MTGALDILAVGVGVRGRFGSRRRLFHGLRFSASVISMSRKILLWCRLLEDILRFLIFNS